MQLTTRRHVLGIPLGKKHIDWMAMRKVATLGLGVASAIGGTVAAAKRGGSKAKDAVEEKAKGLKENMSEQNPEPQSSEEPVEGGEETSTGEEATGEGDAEADLEPPLRRIVSQDIEISLPVKDVFQAWDPNATLGTLTRGPVEVIDLIPEERMQWEAQGRIKYEGVASFHRMSGNLTRLHVEVELEPHGVRQRTSTLLRRPRRKIARDLRLFRHHLELDSDQDGA